MFAYLKGYVAYSGKDFVVIDVNGIGYKVYTANPYEFRKEEEIDVAKDLSEIQKNSLMYTMATRRMSNIITQMKTVINVGK